MYASLIAAGASTLYDLYKSATGTSSSSATRPNASSYPALPDDSSSSPSSSKPTSAVNSTSSSGSGISDALRKLLVDFQASTSTTSGTPSDNGVSTSTAAIQAAGSTSNTASPFQGLASPLSAYARSQGLGASSSTSFTA